MQGLWQSPMPRAPNTRTLLLQLSASQYSLAATQIAGFSSPITLQAVYGWGSGDRVLFLIACCCSPPPPLPCASHAASAAEHNWKAIFLTNDFVEQRSLRLLLFGYPTVTGWFVVLQTTTRITMDRFRA